jgi:glycerol-3-phosphate acyltransferase PlsY
VVLWFLSPKSFLSPLLFSFCVALMILRHRKNIGRLIKGTESKFSLKDKKK